MDGQLRDVNPYALVHIGGKWQLVGHCHMRQDIRHFRLDRMEALSAVAARLNMLCDTLNSEQLLLKARTLDMPLEREVIDLIADTMHGADAFQHTIAYRDGLSDVLTEFTESEAAQQALHVLEEHSLLSAIFGELLNDKIEGVQVLIGGEGRWSEVRHLSLVLTRYGVSGTLGVLGPTRMRYGRAIASVRYVASLLSDLLMGVYDGNDVSNIRRDDLPSGATKRD